MNVLLAPVGSSGDVHPFIGIGLAMRDRGHRVTLVTNGQFAPLAERIGLEFAEHSSVEEYEEVIANPDLWHLRKGLDVLVDSGVRAMRRTYDLIVERHAPGETLILAGGLAFGARLAHETLGVPLVTMHICPYCFRSTYKTPAVPILLMADWVPRLAKRFQFWLADTVVVDRILLGPLNDFRSELGLPAIRRPLAGWWNSPQLVLGLFPDWFCQAQPDWPPNTRLTGFPQYDESDACSLPDELSAFLDAGDAPLVFTPGTAMRHGRAFFETASRACRLLGRRGILLTRDRSQLPDTLPDGVRHFDYLPFSAVLPRAAALIYHGGIGTLAQGLAAGIPHLVMPMSHDQPDNAARLKRLGVGLSVKPSDFRPPAVARALDYLLSTPETASSCRRLARRLREADPLGEACDAIEKLVCDPQVPNPPGGSRRMQWHGQPSA